MYCPEHLIFDIGLLTCWFYDSADIPWKRIPWSRKLNPLRYEFNLRIGRRRFTLNREGRWHVKLSNALWRIRVTVACWWHGHVLPRGYHSRCERCTKQLPIGTERYAVVFDGMNSTRTAFGDLRKGDRFMLFEADGKPEGHGMFTALSDAADGVISVEHYK